MKSLISISLSAFMAAVIVTLYFVGFLVINTFLVPYRSFLQAKALFRTALVAAVKDSANG